MPRGRQKAGIDFSDSYKVALWSCIKLFEAGYTMVPLFDRIEQIDYHDIGAEIEDQYLYLYTRTFHASNRYPECQAWLLLSAFGVKYRFDQALIWQPAENEKSHPTLEAVTKLREGVSLSSFPQSVNHPRKKGEERVYLTKSFHPRKELGFEFIGKIDLDLLYRR
ncbi:MAG: hypothetical protein HYW88_02435, partial [Candidatus Sungbacteria bacterium]|nr:hypothetical protein [Candidatus Sungbacteria bacterium]